MAVNAYAQQMLAKKKREQENMRCEGMEFAANVIAVALNNLYGFGAGRLEAVEKEVERLMTEEFGADCETAAYGLKKRIEQIRGNDFFAGGGK